MGGEYQWRGARMLEFGFGHMHRSGCGVDLRVRHQRLLVEPHLAGSSIIACANKIPFARKQRLASLDLLGAAFAIAQR